MTGRVARHVPPAGVEQPTRPAGIPITRMVDRDRGLNQTLEKTAVRAGRVVPEVFPNLVGLEVLAAVEVLNAGQVARIVFRRRGHAGILSAGAQMLGTRSFDGLATWCRAIRHGHGAGLTLVRMF